MIKFHLELGQLWRCPVEWCTVWKGSMSDCLGHLQDRHGGSQYVTLKNIAKFFPLWTVPRDLCKTALRPDVSVIAVDARLFHEAGCHSWAGLWPSPNSHSCAFPFLRPERPRGRYQKSFIHTARLHGTDGPPSCIVCQ